MRRRRGEPSLFEILREPVEERKKSQEPPGEEPEEEPAKGFWSKARGLGSGGGASATVAGRTPDADDPAAPEEEHRVSKPETAHPRQTERLPELSELESADDEAGMWSWLNRAIEVRYATMILYGVGLLLALFLVYEFGRNDQDPYQEKLMQELQRNAERPSYAPKLNSQPLSKVPLREVESRQEVPKGKSTPPPKKEQASGPKKLYGIVVSHTTMDGADNLLGHLVDAERELGVKAAIQKKPRPNKEPLYQVYFGPFSSKAAADRLLKRVHDLASVVGTDFSDALVMEIEP